MKLCTVCGVVTSHAGSRCTEHARQSNRSRHNAVYSTRAWQRLSTRVLRAWRGEHGDWCPGYQRAAHRAADLTVDHVVPLAAGGAPFDITNTAVVCRSCNSTKGASTGGGVAHTGTRSRPDRPLASVTVAPAAASIVDANITDERGPRAKGTDVVNLSAELLDPTTGHRHEGTTGTGRVVRHADLGGLGTDNHHAKSHNHSGDGSGSVAHAATTGQTATDHHPAPVAGPDANLTVDAAGATGTAGAFARSGHGHQVATSSATPADVAAAGSPGATGSIARATHVHAHGSGYLPDAHHPQVHALASHTGTADDINAWAQASAGGGAAGVKIWVGTTDPGASAAEGDVWVKK